MVGCDVIGCRDCTAEAVGLDSGRDAMVITGCGGIGNYSGSDVIGFWDCTAGLARRGTGSDAAAITECGGLGNSGEESDNGFTEVSGTARLYAGSAGSGRRLCTFGWSSLYAAYGNR